MPSAQEIRDSLRGAWRLLLFDPRGQELFNVSIEGFWRSFFAAVIVLPLYVAVIVIQRDMSAGLIENLDTDMPLAIPSLRTTLIAEAIAYPFYVVAFPIAMVGLARLMRLTGRYVPYIIAYNWAGVIATALRLVPLALYAAGLLGAEAARTPVLISFALIAIYLWNVTRLVLGVHGFMALALVLIDFMLMLLIAIVTGNVVG